MSPKNFVTENPAYHGDESLSVYGEMTQEQFDRVVDAVGACEPKDLPELVKTPETIADFDAARLNNWNEAGRRTQLSDDAVSYERVQVAKGDQRRDLIVIDLGDYRVVTV